MFKQIKAKLTSNSKEARNVVARLLSEEHINVDEVAILLCSGDVVINIEKVHIDREAIISMGDVTSTVDHSSVTGDTDYSGKSHE